MDIFCRKIFLHCGCSTVGRPHPHPKFYSVFCMPCHYVMVAPVTKSARYCRGSSDDGKAKKKRNCHRAGCRFECITEPLPRLTSASIGFQPVRRLGFNVR